MLINVSSSFFQIIIELHDLLCQSQLTHDKDDVDTKMCSLRCSFLYMYIYIQNDTLSVDSISLRSYPASEHSMALSSVSTNGFGSQIEEKNRMINRLTARINELHNEMQTMKMEVRFLLFPFHFLLYFHPPFSSYD